MDSKSKKIRYRKRKRWALIILCAALIGGIALFFFSLLSEKFFREQEKKEISQTRWLYWCPASPHIISEELRGSSLKDTPELRGTSPCYYVNQNGEIATEAPRLKGTLFPKLYDEREGEKRIEEHLLAFVRHFYNFGQFVVENDETLEIGWPDTMRIITTLKDDPKKVAENLALILEKEIGDRRDEVDYIDLRFGNRVYYKFR